MGPAGDSASRGDAIVLIGVSGSGKSTIARLLAAALDAVFLEGDDYHSSSNIAKMRAGIALDDDDRRPWLTSIGSAIAAHGAQGRPVVTACSALRRVYRDWLIEAAPIPLVFVHLVIDPAILRVRMQARRQHFMPTALLDSQLATLEPLQPDEDGTTVAETGTALQTVETIERWLRQRAGGPLPDAHEKGRQRRPSARDGHSGIVEKDR